MARGPEVDQFFNALDVNHDGQLSREEFEAFRFKLGQFTHQAAPQAAPHHHETLVRSVVGDTVEIPAEPVSQAG
eukprot:g26237.t1